MEYFWSILKGKFYENGWEEKKLCHLKPRILKFFGEFEAVTIQAIVEGVKGRVDYIKRNDVIEKREIHFVKLEIFFLNYSVLVSNL